MYEKNYYGIVVNVRRAQREGSSINSTVSAIIPPVTCVCASGRKKFKFLCAVFYDVKVFFYFTLWLSFLLSTAFFLLKGARSPSRDFSYLKSNSFWPSVFEWELKFDTQFFPFPTPCLFFLLFVDSNEESKNRFRYFYGAIILQKWLKTKHFFKLHFLTCKISTDDTIKGIAHPVCKWKKNVS